MDVTEFRNTPMQGLISPAEMFFGRQLCGELLGLRSHMDVLEDDTRCEDMRSLCLGAGANTRSSPTVTVGEHVWMQNHKSLRWSMAAKVIEVRLGQMSPWVRVRAEETFLWSRMFLRRWNVKNVKNIKSAPGMQSQQRPAVTTQPTGMWAKNADVVKKHFTSSQQLRH